MSWKFRPAKPEDCTAAAELINLAYRGEGANKGWTTESHLLGGLRTDANDLRELVGKPNSTLLLAFDSQSTLVGCVHVERRSNTHCYLGMLTVNPHKQAGGLGKALLIAAESFARENYGSSFMEMTVITKRDELIAWYERRGYHRTGKLIPFPVHPQFGVVRSGTLEMEYLQKSI